MIKKVTILILIFMVILSCAKEKADILTLDSSSESFLIISGQDTNHRGITYYDTDGTFIRSTNFRDENAVPRGLVALDESTFLVSVDTTDGIFILDDQANKSQFHGSALFSGGIYDIAKASDGRVYAIESNRIEVFDEDGVRLASNLINTTTGSCTLSTPRGMTINSAGLLIVTNQGGSDNLLFYDISGTTATCIASVAFGNNPYGVVEHSDDSLYVVTQGDDQVYKVDADGSNATVIWATDTSIINNPTAIIEHPNGNLLIASSATDTVEEITTAGIRVGTQPFIRDSHSLNISSMVILGDTDDQ